MNKELAKTLTTALVQFIDENRPEGTMCCSNAECKSIEEMFEGECFDIIEAFIQKKLSRLTKFEFALRNAMADTVALSEDKEDYVISEIADKQAKRYSTELLSLAKKELLKDDELVKKHLEGYIKGREDTLRKMKDFIESQFNTQSGTSTATLHGNTSATDGKEHNPSFTD